MVRTVTVLALMLGACSDSNARSPGVSALAALSAADRTVRWVADSTLIGDFDCDGTADSAFVGRGPTEIHVGVVGGARGAPTVLRFAIGADQQAGVCTAAAVLAFESLDYDPAQLVGPLEGFQRSVRCKGLLLSDGQCDAVHIYWNDASRQFDWWRL